jgi:hypothetical protein
MAGTPINIEGHTVLVWEKSFSIDGVHVVVNREDPEKMTEELKMALEKYRKNENARRRKQFEAENYA